MAAFLRHLWHFFNQIAKENTEIPAFSFSSREGNLQLKGNLFLRPTAGNKTEPRRQPDFHRETKNRYLREQTQNRLNTPPGRLVALMTCQFSECVHVMAQIMAHPARFFEAVGNQAVIFFL